MFSPGLYRTPRCRMTCAPALANWSPKILTPRYFAFDVFDTPPDPAAFLLAARVSEAKMPAGRHSSLNIYSGAVAHLASQRREDESTSAMLLPSLFSDYVDHLRAACGTLAGSVP